MQTFNKIAAALIKAGAQELAQKVVAKDQFAAQIASLISSVLGIKNFKLKRNPAKALYSYEEDDKVFKIQQKGDSWEYIVAIPHINAKGFEEIDVEEDAAFVKRGEAKDPEMLLSMLEKTLRQLANFLKVRKVKFNNNGELVAL